MSGHAGELPLLLVLPSGRGGGQGVGQEQFLSRDVRHQPKIATALVEDDRPNELPTER